MNKNQDKLVDAPTSSDAVLADARADVRELLHMLDESATVMFPNIGYDKRYAVLKKKISNHFS